MEKIVLFNLQIFGLPGLELRKDKLKKNTFQHLYRYVNQGTYLKVDAFSLSYEQGSRFFGFLNILLPKML